MKERRKRGRKSTSFLQLAHLGATKKRMIAWQMHWCRSRARDYNENEDSVRLEVYEMWRLRRGEKGGSYSLTSTTCICLGKTRFHSSTPGKPNPPPFRGGGGGGRVSYEREGEGGGGGEREGEEEAGGEF